MDESQLIARARSGDQEAYGMLVKAHREAVYRAAYHVLKNQDDALDIVQDSFLSAYQSLDRFEGRAQFRTWVRRIAVNRALNRIRDDKHERAVRSLPEGDWIADEGSDGPRTSVESKELKELLHQEIDRLKPEHALAIRLHDIEGLTYAEIADITGIKAGTVMSRIHYARRTLRDRLTRALGDGGSQKGAV